MVYLEEEGAQLKRMRKLMPVVLRINLSPTTNWLVLFPVERPFLHRRFLASRIMEATLRKSFATLLFCGLRMEVVLKTNRGK